MNKYLEQLINLSQFDNEIDAFGPKMQKAASSLKVIQNEESELKKELEKLKDNIKESELKKTQHDLHLKELSEKLNSVEKKSKAIKTEKEQKALALEEEIAKEQIDFANEEIERLDRVIDSKNKQIEELQASIDGVSDKLKECEKNIKSEVEAIEKEKLVVSKDREKLVEQMNTQVLSFYEKIRKWAKNTAIVPVRKQACYGCFIRINDKTYSSVIASEDIVTCPHCGRILYKETNDEQSA